MRPTTSDIEQAQDYLRHIGLDTIQIVRMARQFVGYLLPNTYVRFALPLGKHQVGVSIHDQGPNVINPFCDVTTRTFYRHDFQAEQALRIVLMWALEQPPSADHRPDVIGVSSVSNSPS